VKEPKTKAGKRTIPLSKTARAILERELQEQKKLALKAGTLWDGERPPAKTCYIFCTNTGRVIDYHNLNRLLRNCLESLNLESRSVHALRHTFATNFVRANNNYAVGAKLMGHANISTFLNLYVHSGEDMEADAIGAMASLFD
jgi:site-specific recombinase XerD